VEAGATSVAGDAPIGWEREGLPNWDPDQYLRFERERSLPCRDLIARIAATAPSTIIDLGCGTGTSTALLRAHWPAATVVGLDNSPEMIAAARPSDAGVDWVVGDLRTWTADQPFDLVFSNAALHWVPDHAELFARLFDQVAPGGTLAVQMPVNSESPAHRCIREVAVRSEWASRWGQGLALSRVEPPEFYYAALAPLAAGVELWATEYVHVLPDAAAILEWVKGTTLRPYLNVLPAPADRERFLAEILRGVTAAYPPQQDGRVLFPFRRLFLVAHRPDTTPGPAGVHGEIGK
jgi:trans-aconitate 2-methyltransferase